MKENKKIVRYMSNEFIVKVECENWDEYGSYTRLYDRESHEIGAIPTRSIISIRTAKKG